MAMNEPLLLLPGMMCDARHFARALPSFPEPVICQYWNNPN
jgi:hypothetical protein